MPIVAWLAALDENFGVSVNLNRPCTHSCWHIASNPLVHGSYNNVKGRSHTVEERICMHSRRSHATSQPSRCWPMIHHKLAMHAPAFVPAAADKLASTLDILSHQAYHKGNTVHTSRVYSHVEGKCVSCRLMVLHSCCLCVGASRAGSLPGRSVSVLP